MLLKRETFFRAAREAGFELAGVAPAGPVADYPLYEQWLAGEFAGAMGYLTDHRAELRGDPRRLLPSARSVLCVGKLYKTQTIDAQAGQGRISNYAWGEGDYHDVLRAALERLVAALQAEWGPFEYKIGVDTAPLLERSLARTAGLGWIGKNTCLIHEPTGSWYFLGEVLVSVELPPDSPPPDRCGTCTRCIDACPTAAIVPAGGRYTVDARRCISYHTIELRDSIPDSYRPAQGAHLFGCDICQDVCPWNRRAPSTNEPAFQPRHAAPDLDDLAALSAEEFRSRFRQTPLWRVKWRGLLRNVAVAMGNSGLARFRPALERLAALDDGLVAEHARWALRRLSSS
jgi:epoxyqueuosine reductase